MITEEDSQGYNEVKNGVRHSDSNADHEARDTSLQIYEPDLHRDGSPITNQR